MASLSPDAELMLLMASTRARRERAGERIEELARQVDYEALSERLLKQGLLALIGSRLQALDIELPEQFSRHMEARLTRNRRWGLVVELMTERLAHHLNASGIAAVNIKGPLLANAIHGESGLRPSNDIDLLVDPNDFSRALEALGREGWEEHNRRDWSAGLPLFEASLRAPAAWMPPIDLHWRVDWYEESFSRTLIQRSIVTPTGLRRPSLVDEVTMLLLCYARDGLWGLRLAADLAAWWDAYGEEVPPHALEGIIAEHPKLEIPLRVSASVAERLVGFPAERLLDAAKPVPARAARAARMANWSGAESPTSARARTVLVDLLLSPAGDSHQALRRHFVPPARVVEEIYGLPEGASLRRALRRVGFAAINARECLPGHAEALWRTRGGREIVPLPS